MKSEFTHTDQKGNAVMVDISDKATQYRKAEAEGFIRLAKDTVQLISEDSIKKGDVLTVAKIAGIQAAKKTSDLIPLCHPLAVTSIAIDAEVENEGVKITSKVVCFGRTGVEMEALTAVSMALLTVYDMCKAVDKTMKIEGIQLLEKVKTNIYV